MIRDENRSYNSIKKLFIQFIPLYYFQHTSKRTKVSKMEDTIKAQLRLVDEGRGCSIGFPPIESGEERIAILRRVSTPCKHGTRSPRAPSKLARSEWQDECGWLHSRGFFSRPWQRAGIITRGAATAMVPGTLRILAIVPTFIPPCIFIARRVHEIRVIDRRYTGPLRVNPFSLAPTISISFAPIEIETLFILLSLRVERRKLIFILTFFILL